MNKQVEAPKIEFPCEYHIKVIGHAAPDFKQFVCETVRRHDPKLDDSRVTLQDSSKGRFVSARVVMTATGEPQLKAMFQELKDSGRVQMVL